MSTNYLLQWDKTGEKYFETGTKQGVLFPSLGVVPAFDATAAYAAGAYVTYDGKTYKAKSAITAGTWNALLSHPMVLRRLLSTLMTSSTSHSDLQRSLTTQSLLTHTPMSGCSAMVQLHSATSLVYT